MSGRAERPSPRLRRAAFLLAVLVLAWLGLEGEDGAALDGPDFDLPPSPAEPGWSASAGPSGPAASPARPGFASSFGRPPRPA